MKTTDNLHLRVQARLKHYLEMMAVPGVAAEIIKITSLPGCDVRDLVKVVQRDPALMARILQVANSVFYGVRGRVHDIRGAIARIGMREVRNIALAISVIDEFKDTAPDRKKDRFEFWKYSIASGLLARIISVRKRMNPEQVETAFIAGMLHDLGKVVLFECFPDDYRTLMEDSNKEGKDFRDLESLRLGVTHEEVSDRVLLKWGIPDAIRSPIRMYPVGHRKLLDEGGRQDPVAGATWIAHRLASVAHLGSGWERLIHHIPDPVCEAFGLTDGAASEVMETMDDSAMDMIQILLLYNPTILQEEKRPPALPIRYVRERSMHIDSVELFLRRSGADVRSESCVSGSADDEVLILRSETDTWIDRQLEAAGRDRNRPDRKPALVLSMGSTPDSMQEKFSPGDVHFLSHPFPAETITRQIRQP